MEKTQVDGIIVEFIDRIFGFAFSKTKSIDTAEELAARIVFNVYKSLLKKEQLENIEGYVYRIAHNIYARFVAESVKEQSTVFLGVGLDCINEYSQDYSDDVSYIHLRKEISYLGKIQREIVVMHYFDKLKLDQIALRMNMPLGSVKRHLFNARNELKEKIVMRKETQTELKQIRFIGTYMCGCLGEDGKGKTPGEHLKKLITQNVAYAAYHQPKTISEIASELGVPATFVEDEVIALEEALLMERLPGERYQTNILIKDLSEVNDDVLHNLFSELAKNICERYVPLLFEAMKDYNSLGIYVPEDDRNILMWAIVTFALGYKLPTLDKFYKEMNDFLVERKDGSFYIALSTVCKDNAEKPDDAKKGIYFVNGDITTKNGSWRLDTYYDNRLYDDFLDTELGHLHKFLKGELAKTPENADKFQNLFDKGFFINSKDTETVGVIMVSDTMIGLKNKLPEVPNELKNMAEETVEKVFQRIKGNYPSHLHDVCHWYNQFTICNNVRPRVLERLVANGTLKHPSEAQKKIVNIILFSDLIPELK